MKLTVKLHLLKSAWDNVKKSEEKNLTTPQAGMKTIFNLTVSISTTTPVEIQLVNGGQRKALGVCLSTYNETEKHMCACPQKQTLISCAFECIPL